MKNQMQLLLHIFANTQAPGNDQSFDLSKIFCVHLFISNFKWSINSPYFTPNI